MALDGGGLFALALRSRLLIELAAAHFRQNAGLLAGTPETTHSDFERFIFLYADIGHETGFLVWPLVTAEIKARMILEPLAALQRRVWPTRASVDKFVVD